MTVAARRFRAGDAILVSGSLLLLVAILAHVAAAPAAPSPGRTQKKGSAIVSEGVSDGPATAEASHEVPADAPEPAAPGAEDEPAGFVPNSRSIKSWKDLPVHVVHRPHWVSRRQHPQPPRDGIDAKRRNAELHLELLGYDAESIQFGFDLVDRLDGALTAGREGLDATTRLLDLARGGKEAADLALEIGEGANEEAVRIRALAILATHGASPTVAGRLVALATSEPSGPVRTAAGVSLLWMGREADVARWVASEASSEVISDFFDSVQIGVNKVDERRIPRTLVFTDSRAVESPTLVDVIMEGSAPARWEPAARAKIYSIAARYGGERPEVGAWMEREYGRAADNRTRAAILFAAPRVSNSRGLEDLTIGVARAGGSGYLVRTALFSLGQYRTERSLRVLMEVAPTCAEDTARHAIRALERLGPWFGSEIEPYLKNLAAGHPDESLRSEAAAALKRSFEKAPR